MHWRILRLTVAPLKLVLDLLVGLRRSMDEPICSVAFCVVHLKLTSVFYASSQRYVSNVFEIAL